MEIGRNKSNKNKAARRRKETMLRNRTCRNGRRTIPSSTLKIACGNKVVDLDDLVASAPLQGGNLSGPAALPASAGVVLAT